MAACIPPSTTLPLLGLIAVLDVDLQLLLFSCSQCDGPSVVELISLFPSSLDYLHLPKSWSSCAASWGGMG